MTTSYIAATPKKQFFDNAGNPASGYKLYTYQSGTTTPATTYQDQAGSSANTNPIVLDSRGECLIWLSGTQEYTFTMKTAADVTVWSVSDVSGSASKIDLDAITATVTDLSDDLAASSGSSLIGFIQAGTGAVARTEQSKLRDTVSIKDFGAVGDGTTDDTEEVSMAVATCYAAGARLMWPPGAYLTIDTIPHIHDVRHVGDGALKRGSTLFYPCPSISKTNNLYVSTTGDNANDGLDAAHPMLTIQQPFDAMKGYGPVLNGTWKVNLAAGTYTEGIYVRGLQSYNQIQVLGPDVGGHPNVPTAIIDGTSASNQAGLYFQQNMYIQIQNVKCINFLGSVGYGIVADANTYLYTKNCHTAGNHYAGVSADDGSTIRMEGGIHANNVVHGVRAHDCALFTFGYNGSSSRPQISGSTYGVAIFSGSQGHVDYCDVSGNTYGVFLADSSRAHLMSVHGSTNTKADVYCDNNSSYYDDPATPNTWGSAVTRKHMLTAFNQSQFDKTSDTSNSPIPGLSIDLIAWTTYSIRVALHLTCGAAGGVSITLGGTYTGGTSLRANFQLFNSASIVAAASTTLSTGGVSYTGVATFCLIDLTITPDINCTFNPRLAQNVSNATASSVLTMSSVVATLVAGSQN